VRHVDRGHLAEEYAHDWRTAQNPPDGEAMSPGERVAVAT
jgi:hypothetical protein